MPATQNLANLPDTIDSIPTGGGETWRTWTRPQEWPQYTDSMLNEEVVYLTYDCRMAVDDGAKRPFMAIQAQGAYVVERGNITNGVFTAVNTASATSGSIYFEVLPDDEGDYVVYRVKPASGGHLTRFGFGQASQTGYSSQMPNSTQPCVERFAYLPYVTANSGQSWVPGYKMISDTVKGLSAMTTLNSYYNGARFLEHCVLAGTLASCTTMQNAFYLCVSLYDLDLSQLHITGGLTRADNMFYGCSVLQRVNFGGGGWDMSRVTNTEGMFRACRGLREIKGISSWALTSVTNASYMFSDCGSLQEVDMSSVTSSSSLTRLDYAFNSCCTLKALDLSHMTVSGVQNFCATFYNCFNLKTIDLSSWVMTAATRIDSMFRYCQTLEEIKFGADGLQTSSALTNTSYAFGMCYSLKSIDVSGMVTSGVTNSSYMFTNCNSLRHLDVSNFNLTGITATANSGGMFYELLSLTTITLPTSNVTYLSGSMFRYGRYIERLVFPDSITSIAADACSDLTSALLFDFRSATVVPSLAGTAAFSGNNNSKIVVPDALYSQWIAATNWSSLASRIVSASDYTD